MRSFSVAKTLLFVAVFLSGSDPSSSFSLLFMVRKGQGRLKQALDVSTSSVSKTKSSLSPSKRKGQEITGVTLPVEGALKGWELADGSRLVSCYIDGYYFALQGECPRCSFDLWKGDLIVSDDAWEDLPRVACPTCSTTYSMRTGAYGPPLKRTGLQAFVSGLAKSATSQEANKNAKPYKIIVESDGKIFCREP